MSDNLTTLYVEESCLTKIEHIDLTAQNIELCSNPKEADVSLHITHIKNSELPVLAMTVRKSGAVFIDFIHGKKAHRRQFGGGKNQPLVRAMGSQAKTVLDATAGMGNDGFVLANLGFEVTLMERNPFAHLLLEDGLTRASKEIDENEIDTELSAAIQRISLLQGDSSHYLSDSAAKFDCIYMDPMYPEKKKQAATNKEMTLLQTLAGPDLDSEKLLEAAIEACAQRVIVKRPKGAPPIASELWLPSTEISSPNTRYDIYVKKALKKR